MKTKKIPWAERNVKIFFVAIYEDMNDTIRAVIEAKQLKIIAEDPVNLWWIRKENAINYEIT